MNILAGVCEALWWLVRGDVYMARVRVTDPSTRNQVYHYVHVRAHTHRDAQTKALSRATRRFEGYALEVTQCYAA